MHRDHDHQELTQAVIRLFAEHLHVEVPAADADLIDNGLLDSLMLVELLVQLERQFSTVVSLEDLDIDNFRTVDRIAHYIARGQQQHESSTDAETA